MTYAVNTTVSVEKSQGELKAMLQKRGAMPYGIIEGRDRSSIEFILNGKKIRFLLPLPSLNERRFTHKRRSKYGDWEAVSSEAAYKLYEQACRSRWRALVLAVKAKLETIDSGISTFESEFMAHIVDPATNQTVGEVMLPKIAASYEALVNGSKPLQLTMESSG